MRQRSTKTSPPKTNTGRSRSTRVEVVATTTTEKTQISPLLLPTGSVRFLPHTLEQFPQADVSALSSSPTDTTGRGAGGPLPLSAFISISARPQEQSLHARLLVAQPAPSF